MHVHYITTPQHQTPPPGKLKKKNKKTLFFCSIQKKTYPETMHCHNMTYLATPQNRIPASRHWNPRVSLTPPRTSLPNPPSRAGSREDLSRNKAFSLYHPHDHTLAQESPPKGSRNDYPQLKCTSPRTSSPCPSLRDPCLEVKKNTAKVTTHFHYMTSSATP